MVPEQSPKSLTFLELNNSNNRFENAMSLLLQKNKVWYSFLCSIVTFYIVRISETVSTTTVSIFTDGMHLYYLVGF